MPADATTPAETYDAVIAGGGHNGLVCAAYLARAGLRVKVLERRDRVGGAAVTEEFHPGFRNSVCAYAVSLLNPKVIADLDLHRHGLRIVERPAMNFLPLSGSDYLLTGNGRTKEEIAKFSRRDAARYDDYCAHLERIADALRALVLRPPPTPKGTPPCGNSPAWPPLGKQLGRLGIDGQQELVDLFTLSAADFLDRWFESDPIKALLGFDSIVGTYASPYEPGTAYVLLHHAFGEVNGKKGHWGHAIGGMGAISEAIASNARAHGAEIETGAEIAEILMERDRATGVVLADGRVVRGRTVAANMTLKRLYGELVAKDAQPTAFARRMETFKYGSGTFRMNVALSKLPNFTCLPGAVARDHHGAGIILAPSLDYMDRAYREARAGGWSAEPIIEMLIPSTIDPTLAPPGAHVASLFCQHVAPRLPGGRSWDEARDEVADLMIATVDRYAPGFSESVMGRQVLSPLDLEREFGLTGGDIFHGRLSLNQLFSARPALGYAAYRGPVAGLYHCGSGAHPGGGVTGAPGHNAARAILKDLRPFSSFS
ncbi:FAD-dependent oxidoreductase [Methyloceanibacter methanicus]|uniref:Pyridine nucleotide-disulfide oxidoreductase domain-containing protein 2 n=1 Tax=Methyloceanibacter methanicus TaxID=1774968 RepID=A0A1E3W3J8_9HYPH|nr:NAD(P)/FAD-dependent oxidoreductase [Methyloceanibacter methanicus]ODS00361.1 FAD-dependent oxidoreductase [Methyloceanibacter methanicus]